MAKMFLRILSFGMAAVLCVTLLPAFAFAAEAEGAAEAVQAPEDAVGFLSEAAGEEPAPAEAEEEPILETVEEHQGEPAAYAGVCGHGIEGECLYCVLEEDIRYLSDYDGLLMQTGTEYERAWAHAQDVMFRYSALSLEEKAMIQGGDRVEILIGRWWTEGDPDWIAKGDLAGVSWRYTKKQALKIFCSGAMPDYASASDAPWHRFRGEITSAVIEQGVTYIGSYTFTDCPSLRNVTWYGAVTGIGDHAFQNCPSLDTSIPNTVTSIGMCAFENTGLTSLNLQGFSDLGAYAFRNCAALETLRISSPAVLPNQVFAECQGLSSVIIEPGVTTLEQHTFNGCTSLTSVTLPEGMETLGFAAFANCDSLRTLTIPASVKNIGFAFVPTGISTVVFLGAPVNIDASAFRGVTCTVYYDPRIFPGNMTAQYEGSLTWVSRVDVVCGHGSLGECSLCDMEARIDGMHNYDELLLLRGTDYDVAWAEAEAVMVDYIAMPESQQARLANRAVMQEFLDRCNLQGEPCWIHWQRSEDGTFSWTFNKDNSLHFWGIGPIPRPQAGDRWLAYADLITSIRIGETIGSIEDYAFAGLFNVERVTFEGELLPPPSIGEHSFSGITALVYYPAENINWTGDMFQNYGGSLTWVRSDGWIAGGACGNNLTWNLMEDGVLTISGTGTMFDFSIAQRPSWYEYREFITAVELEPGITSVGSYAFHSFTSLTSASLPESLVSLGSGSFAGCGLSGVTIPSGVTAIGDDAFSACKKLQNVTIPEGVTILENFTFYECTSLTSVAFPEGLGSIRDFVFSGCKNLGSVEFPESIASIGSAAFSGCTGLQEITFRGKAPDINTSAFQNVTAEVYYPGTDATWTQDRRSDYGGELTWVDASVPVAISIAVLPDKTVYEIGESLDTTGLTLQAVYRDGSSELINSGFTVSGFDPVTPGTQTLTVIFQGLTAAFSVTVNPQAAEDAPQIVLSREKAVAGGNVDVQVSLKNNLGINTFTLTIEYDTSRLILTGVTQSSNLTGNFTYSANTCRVVWLASSDTDFSGLAMTLHFASIEGAAGDAAVSVSYKRGNICNYDEEEVNFSVVPGSVTLLDYVPGDINGDGEVNNKDLNRFMKYMADETTEVSAKALDVNGDGEVNNKDLNRLMKYLADNSVEIH